MEARKGWVGIAVRADFTGDDVDHPSVRVDHEGGPLDRRQADAPLDAEELGDLAVGVGQQRVIEGMLVREEALLIDRIGADADPLRPDCLEFCLYVTEM